MALLITENEFDSVQVIQEARADKGKDLFIEGIFLQGEAKNRNGRIYPTHILDREANRYLKEYINTNRAIGELNHPPSPQVNPERASHLTMSMIKEGVNWRGKAKILNTPMGNIVKGLIEGGVQVGVSSRGLGSLKDTNEGKIVQNDYFLSTIDVVSDPSAQSAWTQGIFEGKDWACPSDDDRYALKYEIDQAVREDRKIDEAKMLIIMENYMKLLKKGSI